MKQIIEITDLAADKVKSILSKRDKPSVGIRIGVKAGGCSGLSYVFEYADEIKPTDTVVKDKDVVILIDVKAEIYLIGTTLDYFDDKIKSGFTFKNPNEKARCGCGESFAV